jgi:hypothetical protein
MQGTDANQTEAESAVVKPKSDASQLRSHGIGNGTDRPVKAEAPIITRTSGSVEPWDAITIAAAMFRCGAQRKDVSRGACWLDQEFCASAAPASRKDPSANGEFIGVERSIPAMW